jgi:hypothetical protein
MEADQALQQLKEKAEKCLHDGISLDDLEGCLTAEEAACMHNSCNHREIRMVVESAVTSAIDQMLVAA